MLEGLQVIASIIIFSREHETHYVPKKLDVCSLRIGRVDPYWSIPVPAASSCFMVTIIVLRPTPLVLVVLLCTTSTN